MASVFRKTSVDFKCHAKNGGAAPHPPTHKLQSPTETLVEPQASAWMAVRTGVSARLLPILSSPFTSLVLPFNLTEGRPDADRVP